MGLGALGASRSMLDWRHPERWPERLDLRGMNKDYRVLFADMVGVLDEDDGEAIVVRVLAAGEPVKLYAVSPKRIRHENPLDDPDDRDLGEDGYPNPAYIEAMVKAMRAGALFPPIMLHEAAEHNPRPYDGQHRLTAALTLKLPVVPVIYLRELF